eukprot:g2690.t1
MAGCKQADLDAGNCDQWPVFRPFSYFGDPSSRSDLACETGSGGQSNPFCSSGSLPYGKIAIDKYGQKPAMSKLGLDENQEQDVMNTREKNESK